MSIETSEQRQNIFSLRLSDALPGQAVRVAEVCSEAAQRLAELGLTAGVTVTVIRKAPLGDPLEIAVRGYRLCIRTKTAKNIRVTEAPITRIPTLSGKQQDETDI